MTETLIWKGKSGKEYKYPETEILKETADTY